MSRRGGVIVAVIATMVACGQVLETSDGGPDANALDASDACTGPFCGFDAIEECVGLACDQVACDSGSTTISGFVFDPAGKRPIYDAFVYVPTAPLSPLSHGATCSKCVGSGAPLVAALTDVTGHFVIQNAPATTNVPLVVLMRGWRRHAYVASVTACADNPVDPALTRLPRRRQETSADDDLPQMAITTGGDDALECFVRSLGIDDSEFTSPTGGGRVHLYQGAGGATLATGVPSAASFWLDDGATGTQPLASYDLIMLGCEGGTFANEKPTAALAAMEKYANAGGRVLAMHDQYTWIESNPAPSVWPTLVNWNHAQDPANQTALPTLVGQNFPRGKAMEVWLDALDASAEAGIIEVSQAHHDVDSPNSNFVWSWLYTNPANPTPTDPKMVEALTFLTPLTNSCGIVAYWDLHATASPGGGTFPASCATLGAPSPQQLALEHMIFFETTCF